MVARGDLILLRHALAGRKFAEPLLDVVRSLDRRGLTTATALPDAVLAHARPCRIVSSPFARCTETVRPLATLLGLDVEEHDALRVDASPAERDALLRTVPEHTVLCTHGEVFEQLFEGRSRARRAASGSCAGAPEASYRFATSLPVRTVERLVGAGSVASR